jgi:hypothetical protein
VDELLRLTGLPHASPLTWFLYLTPVLLLALAFPYAALRVRDSRAADPDPQLGLKAGLYFTYSLALLVGLAGLTIAAVSEAPRLLKDEAEAASPSDVGDVGGFAGGPAPSPAPRLPAVAPDWFTPPLRLAAGLAAAGFGLALIHWVLIAAFTNSRRFPEARRVFAGGRFAVSALVVLACVTLLSLLLFAKDPHVGDPDYRERFYSLKATKVTLCAVLALWVPVWLLHLGLLNVTSPQRRGVRTATAALPPAAGPAVPPPPPPAAPVRPGPAGTGPTAHPQPHRRP